MLRIRKPAFAAVATLAVVALALAACSGDDDDTTPTATPPVGTTATAGATGTTSATSMPTEAATATPVPTVDASAIEALVTYYRDLDGREFADAYALWADDGAASGMSLADFTAEYEPVNRMSPLFEGAAETTNGVEVDGRVLLVHEMSDGTQVASTSTVRVTLSDDSGDWLIESIETSGAGNITEAPVDVATPDDLLTSFYEALDAGELPKAYTYWSQIGDASGQDFGDFATGYEDTDTTTVLTGEATMEGAAGTTFATLPAVVTATTTDGTEQVFCGKYTMSRSNLEPFDFVGWRLFGADVAAVDGATADDADQLLANDCTLS